MAHWINESISHLIPDEEVADDENLYLIDFIDDSAMIYAKDDKDAIDFCVQYAQKLDDEGDPSDFVCRPHKDGSWEGEGIFGRENQKTWLAS